MIIIGIRDAVLTTSIDHQNQIIAVGFETLVAADLTALLCRFEHAQNYANMLRAGKMD